MNTADDTFRTVRINKLNTIGFVPARGYYFKNDIGIDIHWILEAIDIFRGHKNDTAMCFPYEYFTFKIKDENEFDALVNLLKKYPMFDAFSMMLESGKIKDLLNNMENL